MKSARFILAAGLAIIAAAGNLAYLNAQEAHHRGGELVPVVAVARQLVAGQVIAEQDIVVRQIPRAYLDERAVQVKNRSTVVGAVTAVDLNPGQVLLWSDVGRSSQRDNTLPAKLASGQRAMTIRVDRSLSLAGLLRPGHRVDILCTLPTQKRGAAITVTVLQNVPVLATGERMESPGTDADNATRFDTATLSVGIEQAQKLALAAATGKLSLVLRGHDDLAIQRELPLTQQEDLSGGQDKRGPGSITSAGTPLRAIERLLAK